MHLLNPSVARRRLRVTLAAGLATVALAAAGCGSSGGSGGAGNARDRKSVV